LFMLSEDNGKTFLYSRAGDFTADNNGNVVDANGRKLYGYKLDENGNALTSQLVPIKTDGLSDVGWEYKGTEGKLVTNYTAYKAAQENGDPLPDTKPLYQIALTTFSNRSGLLQNDGTTFKETIASGPAQTAKAAGQDYGSVHSQSLEKSNVFYIGEMLDALAIQRAMSASLTAIKLANSQIQNVIQQLGS
jgi:flagellar hook protein FlgE